MRRADSLGKPLKLGKIEAKRRRDYFPTKKNDLDYCRAALSFYTYYQPAEKYADVSYFENEIKYLKEKINVINTSGDDYEAPLSNVSYKKQLELIKNLYPLCHFKHTYPFYEKFDLENPRFVKNLASKIHVTEWPNMTGKEMQREFFFAMVFASYVCHDPFSAYLYNICGIMCSKSENENLKLSEIVKKEEVIKKHFEKYHNYRMSSKKFAKVIEKVLES